MSTLRVAITDAAQSRAAKHFGLNFSHDVVESAAQLGDSVQVQVYKDGLEYDKDFDVLVLLFDLPKAGGVVPLARIQTKFVDPVVNNIHSYAVGRPVCVIFLDPPSDPTTVLLRTEWKFAELEYTDSNARFHAIRGVAEYEKPGDYRAVWSKQVALEIATWKPEDFVVPAADAAPVAPVPATTTAALPETPCVTCGIPATKYCDGECDAAFCDAHFDETHATEKHPFHLIGAAAATHNEELAALNQQVEQEIKSGELEVQQHDVSHVDDEFLNMPASQDDVKSAPDTESDEEELEELQPIQETIPALPPPSAAVAKASARIDTAEKFYLALLHKTPEGKVWYNDVGVLPYVHKFIRDIPRILIQLAHDDPRVKVLRTAYKDNKTPPITQYNTNLMTKNALTLRSMVFRAQFARASGKVDNIDKSEAFPFELPDVSEIKQEVAELEKLWTRLPDGLWVLKPYQLRRVWGESVQELAKKHLKSRTQGIANYRDQWERKLTTVGVAFKKPPTTTDAVDIPPLLTLEEAKNDYTKTFKSNDRAAFALYYNTEPVIKPFSNMANVLANPIHIDTEPVQQLKPIPEEVEVQDVKTSEVAPIELDDDDEVVVVEDNEKPSEAPQPSPQNDFFARFSAADGEHVVLQRDTTRRFMEPREPLKFKGQDTRTPFIYAPKFLCGPLKPFQDNFYPVTTLAMLYASACPAILYYSMLRETHHEKQDVWIEENDSDTPAALLRVLSRYYSKYPPLEQDYSTIPQHLASGPISPDDILRAFGTLPIKDWVQSKYLVAAQCCMDDLEVDGDGYELLPVVLQGQHQCSIDGAALPWTYHIKAVNNTRLYCNLQQPVFVGTTVRGESAVYEVAAVLKKKGLWLKHLGRWYRVTKGIEHGHDITITPHGEKDTNIVAIKAGECMLVNRVR